MKTFELRNFLSCWIYNIYFLKILIRLITLGYFLHFLFPGDSFVFILKKNSCKNTHVLLHAKGYSTFKTKKNLKSTSMASKMLGIGCIVSSTRINMSLISGGFPIITKKGWLVCFSTDIFTILLVRASFRSSIFYK